MILFVVFVAISAVFKLQICLGILMVHTSLPLASMHIHATSEISFGYVSIYSTFSLYSIGQVGTRRRPTAYLTSCVSFDLLSELKIKISSCTDSAGVPHCPANYCEYGYKQIYVYIYMFVHMLCIFICTTTVDYLYNQYIKEDILNALYNSKSLTRSDVSMQIPIFI